jgi:alkylation response protein AidB-like acyl-CoA dehydrogenase
VTDPAPDLAGYRRQARAWLASQLPERQPTARTIPTAEDLAVFHDLDPESEARLLEAAMDWQRRKFDAGFGAITWPVSVGGSGLSAEHERAFAEEEAAYAVPEGHEVFSITLNLIAPTISLLGTPAQRDRFIARFLRTEELCCQLFSEPGAGSDLASLGTMAERHGDEWVLNGQKVWTSGARFAAWGELLARSDPDRPKHAGITAFLIPMDAAGIEVRPIRQMSGGSSFNEVFLADVVVSDSLRLGEVHGGWQVALTTLGFERGNTRGTRAVGGTWDQLAALAQRLGATRDPLVRQRLADVYIHHRIAGFVAQRIADSQRSGQPPGPEGSIRKLGWVRQLTRIAETAAQVLGPRLQADGDDGGYAWASHLLGAPGYHVAGGSDEIQHNIIAERVLGLPGDPRADRGAPWRRAATGPHSPAER